MTDTEPTGDPLPVRDDEREITIELLSLANRSGSTRELVRSAVTFFRERSGCEAVGIRLRDGDDYPYYETHGFPGEFVRLESHLCTRGAGGQIVRDSAGNPVLECMCGNVICGRFDSSMPFFTALGSFWTNSTSRLLASTSEADRQARTRNRCNGEGYESVALFPLSAGGERLGLLQLNDRRPNRFNARSVTLWERLAGALALALARSQAEERFSAIANYTVDWESWFGPDGNCRWVSPSVERITGYSPAEILAMPDFSAIVIAEEDRALFAARFREALSGSREENFEFRCVQRNGAKRWLSGAWQEILDADGHSLGVRTTFRDISKRKSAEEALARHESDLQSLFDAIGEAVFLIEPDGRIVTANETFAARVGRPVADVVGQSIYGLIPPEFASRRKLFLEEVLRTGRPVTFEDQRQGTSTLHSLCPVLDADGSVRRVAVYAADTTERRRAAETTRTMAEMLDLAPCSIVVLDWEGRFLYANDKAFVLYGYSKAEFMGLSARQVSAPESARQLDERMRLIEERGEALFEVSHCRKDGSTFPLEVFAKKVTWSGKPAILSIATDITDRRRAGAALKESRELLHAILNTIPVRVFWKDTNLVYLGCNTAFARDAGFESPEEVVGKDDWAMAWREQAELYRAGDRAVIESGKMKTFFEEPQTTLSGSRINLLTSKMPLKDSSGAIVGVLGAYLDISDRKRAEEALRESEEVHRALVAGLPDVVMRFDRNARHLFVSDRVRDVTGLQAAQFIGKTHRELGFPQALCGFWEESIQRVFDSRLPFETEFTYEGKQGPAIFNWRLVPEFDARGTVRSVLSLSRDITAHRRAEENYQTLFREMLDGFALQEAVCDAAGRPVDCRFLAVNPAFERMMERKAEEIVGRTVLEVMPGLAPALIQNCGNVALSGEPAFFETHDASLGKHFELTVYRPAPGQCASLVVDITARKRAEHEKSRLEAQLQQAQKMESIGRLAGGIAHDFNNLLTVINGYSQLALSGLRENDPLRSSMIEIYEAGQRAVGLTRQLLAFSRKQILQPRVLDLNRVIQDLNSMLGRLVGEDVEVLLALKAEEAMVHADPHQLEQVIMNLAVNARDAMPDGGTLLIETAVVERGEAGPAAALEAPAGRYVVMSVSDTGTGMDESVRRRAFDPFFTTKEPGKGTGLGLSVVQGIVTQSGGFIEVHSEPGRGATFKVHLPALAEASVLVEEPPMIPDLRGRETILVVEDQAEVRNYAAGVLNAYGYRTIQAADAAEALQICERTTAPIHMVLTDVVMPHIGGRELVSRLTQVRPGMKVLFMSGYTDDVIVHHRVLENGAQVIQKPFSPEELAGKVRAALGPAARGARVLVADDEAGVRSFIRNVLQQAGYRVSETGDGRQVVANALAGAIDLVILDLVMPEQEGLETITALRRQAPGIGIIAISGIGGPFLKIAQVMGADAVLGKPVGADTLLANVAQVLLRRG